MFQEGILKNCRIKCDFRKINYNHLENIVLSPMLSFLVIISGLQRNGDLYDSIFKRGTGRG